MVQLPPNADLFIDNQRSQLKTETRTVVTPALDPGESYYYEIRVETVVDGKKVSDQKRVLLRAGGVSQVDFRNLDPVASKAKSQRGENVTANR